MIENQPRLVLDQQIQDEVKNPSFIKKLVNPVLGLFGMFGRDSIQKTGKTPQQEAITAAEKGSYPYCPYDTCKTAEDFSKFTVGKRSLDETEEAEMTPSTQKEEFVSAAEKIETIVSEETAGQEEEETVTETKKSEVNQSIIQDEMHRVFQEFNDELTKGGETNFNKLEELIRKYVMLATRNMGITDERFRESLQVTLKIEQREEINAISGWKSKLSLGIELVGAGVTAGLGGLGAGIQSARGLASSAQTLSNFSQTARIADPLAKIPETYARSDQTRYRYASERVNQYMQQSVENKRNDEQQQQQAKTAIDEMIRSNHNTFSTMLSTGASS